MISSLGILGGFVSTPLIGWIKGAACSIRIGLLGLIALVIGGGLTILLGLPKNGGRLGPGEGTSTH
ncbi:hypothetical protein OKW26_002903 [Paraburkholderia sp. 32]